MAKRNFKELLAKMTPEARTEVRERANVALAQMPLQGLRRARQLSQETLASALGATQPQISKIEHRTDLYLRTIRRYVQAMGGQLDIVAHFPEGSVRINQFHDVAPEPDVDWGAFHAEISRRLETTRLFVGIKPVKSMKYTKRAFRNRVDVPSWQAKYQFVRNDDADEDVDESSLLELVGAGESAV